MGLLKPFKVLLLDEVTVDLDVVSRTDLLEYLKQETETRGATILYATHIFDGLDHWATHLAHVQAGGVIRKMGKLEEFPELMEQFEANSTAPLMKVVDGWLRAERRHQSQLERAASQVKELTEEGFEKAEAKMQKRYLDDRHNRFDGPGARDQYNYW
jgi:CCR4-NOT complex subunit CAF16